MRIGILGAGLSGLSLAYFLQAARESDQIELVDKEPSPGGLCRSFAFGNIHYDIGPHILFSKDSEVLSLMLGLLGENVHKLRRSNKIFHDGRFVKYPFENGLSDLPLTDNFACLAGFTVAAIGRSTRRKRKAKNLREWCLTSFGRGISKRYLIPYNEKIWKFPLTEISTGWVERIPNPPWKDVVSRPSESRRKDMLTS